MIEPNFSKYIVKNRFQGKKLSLNEQIRTSMLKINNQINKKKQLRFHGTKSILSIISNSQSMLVNQNIFQQHQSKNQSFIVPLPKIQNNLINKKSRVNSTNIQVKRNQILNKIINQSQLEKVDQLINMMSTNLQKQLASQDQTQKQKYQEVIKKKKEQLHSHPFIKNMKRSINKIQKNRSLSNYSQFYNLTIERQKMQYELLKNLYKISINQQNDIEDKISSHLNQNQNQIKYIIPNIQTSYKKRSHRSRSNSGNLTIR